jgi:hypothetical protein
MAGLLDTTVFWLWKLQDALQPPSQDLLNTRLMKAQGWGSERLVRHVLKSGADPRYSPSGASPLLAVAAAQGQLGILEALLDHGAEVNAAASNGTTPLMLAADNGDFRSASILMKFGADLCCRDAFNKTAFDYASGAKNWNASLEWRLKFATEKEIAEAEAKAAAEAVAPPEPAPFIVDVTTGQELNLARPLRLKTGATP